MEETKETVEGVQGAQTDSKTYSKEDIEKLVQAESDRKVALAQKEWVKKTQKQLAETEKLAKMDEAQRAAHELETAKAELEQMKLEKAISENTTATLQVLAKRELPAELLDYVLTEDAESTLEKIDSLQKILKKWVDAEVSKKLPTQGAPKTGTVLGKITKEEFSKWSLGKQAQLSISNPELYKELTK